MVMTRMKAPYPPLMHTGGIADCGKWRLFRELVFTRVTVPSSMLKINTIFASCQADEDLSGSEGCPYCSKTAYNWLSRIKTEITYIPPFRTFL